MFGFGKRDVDEKVRYEITGKFIIAARDEQEIDREIQNVEKQVRNLQRMGMTGIESWIVIEKKKL